MPTLATGDSVSNNKTKPCPTPHKSKRIVYFFKVCDRIFHTKTSKLLQCVCIWNFLFKFPPCGVSSGIIYTHLTFLENNPVHEVFKCSCLVLSWAVSWLLKVPAYVLVPTSFLFIHLHTLCTRPPPLIMLTSSLSIVFPLRQLWNVLRAVFSASLISTALCIFLLLLCWASLCW